MNFPRHIIVIFVLSCMMSSAQNKATHRFTKSKAIASENFQSMTFNGVWSWFSDPRAVYFEGKHKRTYAGWIDNYGDVHIGFYDHDTKEIKSHVVYDNLEIDDHDNPSILFDATGRLLIFFNTHLQDERPLFMRTSTNPEDVSNWSPIKELYLNNDEKYNKAKINRHTYTNPVRLSKEDGKLYLFWRGIDLKPSYSVSTDHGNTWSKGEIIFMPNETTSLKSPYTKVYSDGNSKIHFTFTDDHPTREDTNGLYYMYYENGAFYKANGTKIKDVSQLPILQNEMDVIFESDTMKSWNWDIAQDANENPIVTYVKFPKDDIHIYSYATFSKNEWNSYDLLEVNGWFPETRKGTVEAEPHYAGGIVIDHENPNIIYVSVRRKNIFEIEQWTTQNKGKSWNVKKITQNSTKNNVRPFAVRGAKKGNPLQVLWLQNTKYVYYSHDTRGQTAELNFKDRYQTAVKMNLTKSKIDSTLTIQNLTKTLRQVAEHQLENPNHEISKTNWKYGVFYAGLEAFAAMTKEARYENELLNIKQYQTEEEEEVNNLFNSIWAYQETSDRITLQKIESITYRDFSNREAYLTLATQIKAIEKFDKEILAINELKKGTTKETALFLEALNSYYVGKTVRTKALMIYSVAAGIRNNLFDKKYIKDVKKQWGMLQQELIEKNLIRKLDVETNGAILLAGKEIFEILNEKR
ncbi:BNR-4 repeat-containing protein [Kordia sp.]|uniref:BNR-4 repeat-containing protein n=1 Tax=Kordia sp. TaxID=1965332 RepID=UPI003D29138B